MPRPAASHAEARRPTARTALVAASIVHAFDPRWLARPLGELARELEVRPEQPSRIKRRVLAGFERLVAQASRRGRPEREPPHPEADKLRATEALLALAAEIIRQRGVGRGPLREQLVAALDRLAREHRLTRRAFCQALGLSERTVRSWADRARRPHAPPPLPDPKPTPRPRSRRRGRFALEVTPAGVQAMADTTDWKLFGVPLAVLAVQDPGARDVRLWEAAEVAIGQDADRVIALVRDALGDRPGTQFITDQGTPYLAEASRAVYEELELDHAPQREGNPTAKATLERSFLTVKSALEPLAALSHRLAQAVPALAEPHFAAAVGRLLVGTFLAVHLRARAGATSPARALSAEAFAARAGENREKARAEDRSRRLTLERIHAQYDMPRSRATFVRAFRHHRVEDLLEAERLMGVRACRCHARACDRYFAAVVHRVSRESAEVRRGQREQALRLDARRQEERRFHAERERWRQQPEEWLAAGLGHVAVQWCTDRHAFLFGDPVCCTLESAIQALTAADPDHAADRIEVGWNRWAARQADDPERSCAVRQVLDRTLAHQRSRSGNLTHDPVSRILASRPTRRPPSQPPLRI